MDISHKVQKNQYYKPHSKKLSNKEGQRGEFLNQSQRENRLDILRAWREEFGWGRVKDEHWRNKLGKVQKMWELVKRTEIVGVGVLEISDMGNSQCYIRATLLKTLSTGYMETRNSHLLYPGKISNWGIGHQPMHKRFDHKIFLTKRYTVIKLEQNVRE